MRASIEYRLGFSTFPPTEASAKQGDKAYIQSGDIPFLSMHGDHDATVPYATATIYLLGVFPITRVDGSYSIAEYANSII